MLTCIQVSQEAGKVVWYSHLLKNFPQFVVIHTVKGFGVVNKAEVDGFLELPCFLYSLQLKMEKLYMVSKNKTRSWLWLKSWTSYCIIQTKLKKAGKTIRPFRYDLNQIGKLSSGHRTGRGQFSFQSQRKPMPKNLKLPHNCIHLTC